MRGQHPNARTSTVDERDIAVVAALALTHPQHLGQTYLLTGEQSLSQPEKVAALGVALDRTLSFSEAAPDEIRRGMLAAGLPDEVPDRLLGSLADYARERAHHRHRAGGCWAARHVRTPPGRGRPCRLHRRRTPMKLTIVAATGGIGRHLVEQAVAGRARSHRRGPPPA
ncbi:hypothetical protein SALBM311S_09693 [Streptomyces alboniger]